MKALLAIAILALPGCASTSLLIEGEHISHPLAGWPCEKQRGSEDGISQVGALLRFRSDTGLYLDAGMGVNLEGRNGGGIYGPALMGTIRAGLEVKL